MNQDTKMMMSNPRVFWGTKGFHRRTFDELGQLIGMDASNMSRLVKGHRYITRDRAERLCEALQVRVEDIFEEVRR